MALLRRDDSAESSPRPSEPITRTLAANQHTSLHIRPLSHPGAPLTHPHPFPPVIYRMPVATFPMDMRLANSVASMPGGHSRALSTMVGMNSTFWITDTWGGGAEGRGDRKKWTGGCVCMNSTFWITDTWGRSGGTGRHK